MTPVRRILYALLHAGIWACTTSVPAIAQSPVEVELLQSYRLDGDDAMHMPTGVAVDHEGDVYVADGVNDRVVRFAGDGSLREHIKVVGDAPLSGPLSVAIDSTGRLWVADSGRHRILVRARDGSLERTVTLPDIPDAEASDITDVAVAPDAKVVWVVDNEHHRVVRIELATGAHMPVGKHGESLGQFQYPFMVDLLSDGSVCVTDVLNGRIARLGDTGAARTSVGTYGVEPGQLYRPTGVAVDGKDRIWVADGVLNVVQVFSSMGEQIGAAQGSDGRVFRFDHPMGMCFDRAGDLYVCELEAHQVRRFRATIRQPDARPVPGRAPARAPAQARGCTLCHVEWMQPYAQNQDSPLAPMPRSTPEEPIVSQSDTCLSCHDGTVVDSRRRVWLDHGHRTGVSPPESMKVPQHLPLVDGKVACRTCHSAHAGGTFTADLAKTVFLRAGGGPADLCIQCHQDKTKGPGFGTHPTGGMPWAVPKALLDAGARVGANPRELTCRVCHTPHGSSYEHLLVLGVETNQLCVTCHDQMRPGMFRSGDHTEHPLTPKVNAEQAAAIQEMGTRMSPEGQLVCLSCHKLHHGKGERFLLADDLTDGRMCIRCHTEKTSVANTVHDLRVTAPEERNRLGMTATSGGPCSSCHLFHRYARAPEISELDPGGGKCITCHQSGRCAGEKALGPINHPKSACTECHDPHRNDFEHFMKARPRDLCVSCHADQRQLAGGPHDIARAASEWPEQARQKQDTCLACHRPHGNEASGLFRVAPLADAGLQDGACLACHSASTPAGDSPHSLAHPLAKLPEGMTANLPLVTRTGQAEAVVGCRTCHDPHGNLTQSPALLRCGPGQPAHAVCLQCHSDARPVTWTAHGTISAPGGSAIDACGACHDMHTSRGSAGPALLQAVAIAGDHGDAVASNRLCTGCHAAGGQAPPPRIATHPDVPMANLTQPDARGFLPLFDSQGQVAAAGSIGCGTCHLPHGQVPPGAGGDMLLERMSEESRRAMRLLLRPFVPPNACTTCHGTDGLRRFLYYHDPQRREGPLDRAGSR